MNKRFSLLLTVTLAFMMAFPVLNVAGSEEEVSNEEPSRYGFTPTLYRVADPTSEAICVATGDFDNANNDDLVIGFLNEVQIMKNNGGSGSSFNFNLHQTVSTTGFYITRVEFADYDNDDDLDIIALGQEEYYMANEGGTGDPVIMEVKVFYIENELGTFSIEDTQTFYDAFLYQSLWYYSDSKYDMAIGDLDGDNDMDTVLFYNQDTDGVANTGGERVMMKMISYSPSGLSNSTILSVNPGGAYAEFNPLVGLGDFDDDDNLDIVYSYGGPSVAGGFIEARLFIMWHTGVGSNWGLPVDLDPNDNLVQGGIFGSIPFALAIGEFGGNSLPDIALTNNRNGGTSPPFGDAGVYLIRAKDSRSFADPSSAYSQVGDFMIREMAVGDFDKAGREDIVCFTKQDQTADPSPYDGIDGYGLSLLGSRQTVPYQFFALKVFESPSSELPYQVIKSIGVGDFDNDPNEHQDVVYVGDYVTVGLTKFPPNNVPTKIRETVNPSPVLNKNNMATINLTIEDLDGNWDLRKIEVDFTPIGMPLVVVDLPTKDPNNNTIGWYEFDVTVPETVRQGDYDIKFYMYDNCPDPPGKSNPKSNDTFLFRVKQYNRHPEIALSEENRTFIVKEDTPTYFEGVYDWFVDLDIEDGYAPDMLNISMRSFKSDTYVTSSVLETDQKIMEVYLKNGSAANPQDWSLLVVPAPNFHSKEGEFYQITLRAYDGELRTNPNLKISVFIEAQNDEPIIPPQKRYESDDIWEFSLQQGDRSTSFLMTAVDNADGQTPYLEYFFEYEDPADEEWLYISRQGTVSWFPQNEHVGPHKVTLWVSDSKSNVSQELWFNVSNVNDRPRFEMISNGTTTITEIPRYIQQRYEFIVMEHEEFNLTIKASDLDSLIGIQDMVNFKCNLTQLNNTYLTVDEDDPFTAYFHFWAEKKYGYFATFEPSNPPIETEIIISDQDDSDMIMVLPIRIIIENVNDPPAFVSIDKPEEGFYSPILYNVEFSAGRTFDPDTDYNDTLTYQWDFDATDGPFKADFTGLNGRWDFQIAGNYMITLRIVDSAGNYIEAYTNITVDGVKNDDDYDNDGMPNKWEDENGFNKYDPEDATNDDDGDGWTNIVEFLNMTDPNKRDTDGDGSIDSEDYSPLDSTVYEKPKETERWIDDTNNIILLVIIAVVVIIALLGITGFFLYRSMQKSKEEEERRKKAEEMQRSMYEGQDLYEDLPSMEQPAAGVAAAPEKPQLPPQEEGDLDDIFGGAGTLPTSEGAQQGLPPGPEGETPQGQTPAQQGSEVGDVTDLLDQ